MVNGERKRLDNGIDEDIIIPSPAPLSEMDEHYVTFIERLKRNISAQRVSVALRANVDVICQYWHVGKHILEQQERYGWGAKVIDRISYDLSKAFPDAKGFSPRNLTYMRRFAKTWPDPAIVQQLVALLPWSTNIILMEKLSDQEQRMWYAQQAIKNG
jgi:predicted nuclease of restriction endonuclease-like (RecB) superfamily